MDSAQRASSGRVSAVYDGFISYSHAADDLLAPRLQSGLQRFAKPWWKRRALRIFRDESSLSANPHLWSSITEALDGSGWFVLLLSEEAAQSEWVNREVEYWLQHKDASRILPVVTDGEFFWADGDIGSSSTAAPPALSGAFREEPRWVDLRWARTDVHLDLNNPRFSDAVADIASAIRGVPKDELASEEVKQHRRTIRTAWAAAVVVLLLGIAATVGAVVAVGQSNEARDQRDEAEKQAQIASDNEQRALDAESEALQLAEDEAEARADAEEQQQLAENERDRANSERDRANEERDRADIQTRLARSGELAASAVGVLDRDPELALLLTLQAASEAPEGMSLMPETRIALREALAANRLLDRVRVADSGAVDVDFLPGGLGFVTTSVANRSVTRWDFATGTEVWSHHDPDTTDSFWTLSVSPLGDLVAVGIVDRPFGPGVEDDGLDARTLILDTASGDVVHTIYGQGCRFSAGGFSPDGRYLILSDGTSDCEERDSPNDTEWVSLIDTANWQEVARFAEGAFDVVSFTDDMSRLVVSSQDQPARILSFPGLEPIVDLQGAGASAAISPDGSRVVTEQGREGSLRPRLWDAETGEHIDELDGFESFVQDLEFSPDGTMVVASGFGPTFVWDAATGTKLFELPTGPAVVEISDDGRTLASASLDGEVLFWNLAGTEVGRQLDFGAGSPNRWVNPNQLSEGDTTVVHIFEFFEDRRPDLSLVAFDVQSGGVTSTLQLDTNVWVQLADGRVVVPILPGDTLGPLHVWDPSNDTVTPLEGCSAPFEEWIASITDAEEFLVCENGRYLVGELLAVSADGTELAVSAMGPPTTTRIVEIFDTDTLSLDRTIEIETRATDVEGRAYSARMGDGWLLVLDGGGSLLIGASYAVFDSFSGERIATLDDAASWRGVTALSSDGSKLYLSDNAGGVWEYDTTSWELLRDWKAHEAPARGLTLSPDGSFLVSTAGEDNFVTIWDLETLTLVDRIPMPFPSDAMWIDDDTLGVILRSGEWVIESLLDVDLLDRAAAQLTRSFSDEECRLYGIGDCPTLEAMRNR